MSNFHLWHPKGGQGCSTLAVGLALHLSAEGPTELVPMDPGTFQDHLAILGLPAKLEGDTATDVRDNLRVVTVPEADGVMHRVYDWGTNPGPKYRNPEGTWVCVMRPCYLALRAFVMRSSISTDIVALVTEEGRALNRQDVEACTGHRAVEVAYDRSIMRAVDAGLLAVRMPAHMQRSIRDLLHVTARV